MRTVVLAAASLILLSAACSDDETGSDVVLGDATAGDGADATGTTTDTTGTTGTTTDATGTTATDTTATTTTDTTGTTGTTTDATGTTAQDADTSGPVQICFPDEWVCASTAARHQCNNDGTGFGPNELCGGGFSCRNGQCLAKCPNDPKFGVYVGCEFWATDLPNYPDPTTSPTPENSPWAIVVSNPGLNQVTVSFEMPPLFSYSPPDPIVEPGEAKVFELPNINVQGTSLMPKGVHVTATGPVTVHQFNPYNVRFSNDASLLVPDPLLGDEYVILSWTTSPIELGGLFPGVPNQNGYFTVIAAFDDTTVTIQPSARVKASGPIPALAPGQIHRVRMNRGDVLSIQADPATLFENADPTGSRVTADKPISVFGGHEEAVIGEPIPNGEGGTTPPCCADHLEEQMLPLNLAGTSYFALHSPPRSQIQIEPDWWRIVALEPNVTITTDPPQPDAHNVTLGPIGSWVGFKSQQSFTVTATGKVQIGQYTASRDMTEDFTGDASLVLMVATDRFRKDYVFLAPDFETGGLFGTAPDLWATVVKPASATLTVDGQTIHEANFVALGTTGYEYTYVRLLPGVHEASAAEPFGLYVHGYNNAVSFSYIGGISVPGE